MSSDVVLTAALRNNLLSLQNTQRLIDTTQLRLATGLKVNSALDNPQNFFASQSLNNRANDLQRLLDGISQSIRTIEEANTGVTALTRLIEQAESVAIEAQSEARAAEGYALIRGTEDLTGVDLVADTAIDANDAFSVRLEYDNNGTTTNVVVANVTITAGDTVDSIVAAINSSGANADLVRAKVTEGGQLQIESLKDGGVLRVVDSAVSGTGGTELDLAGFQALGFGDFVSAENTPGAAGEITYGATAVAGNVIYSGVSTAATVSGLYESSATLNAAGFLTTGGATINEIQVNISVDGTSSANINLANGTTIQEFIDGINNDANVGTLIEASFNTSTGQIELQGVGDASTVEIQYTDLTGTADANFGFGYGASDAAIASAAFAASEQFVFVGTSNDLAQYEEDFNNIRAQIDTLVEDANYRGVNLLGGDDLTTYFNEDRDNTLVTDGVDFTATGLGIAEGSFTNVSDIQTSVDDVRTALGRVRNFGTSIANDLNIIQTRRDFTEQTINTLTSGADDLVVADQNEEGANLLALQTRQALGTTSLSLASQSQQSVLRLF